MEKWQIQQLAANSPGYKTVQIDDVDRNILVVRSGVITSKYIYALPNEDFDVGQVVYWNGSHWLITQRDLDNDIITRGFMEQCNREITWQNPKTRKIFSLWATVKKPYYSNLESSGRIEVSTREFKIQMPYTDESKLINIGKRFMLETIDGEPKTYRCTSIDSITDRYDRDGRITGFINMNVEQDLYNPDTDNMEVGICDYLIPDDYLKEVFDEGEISFRGEATVKAGGSRKRFTGKFNNSDDIGTWDVDFGEIPEDELTYEVDGNDIRISVADNMYLVGKTFILRFKDSDDNISAEIEIGVI